MQETLKIAENSSVRSRRLNTIMEIVENLEEHDNSVAEDSNFKISDVCKACSDKNQQCGKPSRNTSTDLLTTTIYKGPSERRIAFTHASHRPHTFSIAPSHWREKERVSITPAPVIRSSSESSPFKPSGSQNSSMSEVELFFPEFFKDNHLLLRTELESNAVCKELKLRKSVQDEKTSNDDPLVQSWLSLFGSQVYG